MTTVSCSAGVPTGVFGYNLQSSGSRASALRPGVRKSIFDMKQSDRGAVGARSSALEDLGGLTLPHDELAYLPTRV